MTSKNVFVLGLDEMNLATLRDVDAPGLRFHPLLSIAELQADEIDLPGLLDKATVQLEAFDGPIDAIVGYWDFPISSMVPMLCARFGLRSADLDAVVKCEHKYWSRLEQAKVIDDYPAFGLVDPFHDTAPPEGLDYPMWIKPVKSFSSELAFKVCDDAEFANALAEIRDGIHRIGDPFEYVLSQLDLPDDIAAIGGNACLAEAEISGAQLTVEGYNDGTDIHIYGIVDSVPYAGSSSFLRYEYPSTLSEDMIDRAIDASRKVIRQIGLESVAFNIEFFADPVHERLALLEVNPRHSQSHARLFELVDGTPNHQCMIRLALGLDPALPDGQGPYEHAAKWYLRRFEDAYVRRVPSAEDIERVQGHVSDAWVEIVIDDGVWLSDAAAQDSYSYELAHIFIGAHSQQELDEKYEQCVAGLPFEFDE
ncbi:ATP-grasp domain-containing protein [Haloechinothrix halophila]|uniref:ATP-grasp domain-containing protein n=1 Tax=Haloechinothrix halophila TaxID=1069073 RepID=UPI0003F5A57D|nr:ATP-grasp domain-containing protein [Haloechinothrix halophila]